MPLLEYTDKTAFPRVSESGQDIKLQRRFISGLTVCTFTLLFKNAIFSFVKPHLFYVHLKKKINTLCVSASDSQDLVLTVSIKTNTIIENNFKWVAWPGNIRYIKTISWKI